MNRNQSIEMLKVNLGISTYSVQ